MHKIFASLIASIAMMATSAASFGCPWFAVDEPKASNLFKD